MLSNPFDMDGHWYKANLHTHTTVSDGGLSPEGRIQQYRDHGYDILAITDHHVSSDMTRLSTADFLVIDGVEFSPRDPVVGRGYHLTGINVQPGRTWGKEEDDANDLIAATNEAGGVVFVAHPYFCGNNITDLCFLEGYAGIEVFNASCIDMGKADSTVIWDIMLETGLRVPAVAVDDTHSGPAPGSDTFQGFTMLRLPEPSTEAAVSALKTGCYYASCGPEIHDFRVEDGVAHLRCSPAKEVRLMGWRYFGRVVRAESRQLLREMEAEVHEGWRYVRAEVIDYADRHAWTNPIFLT